ncbi:putative chemosensory receptor 1 [Operophtera brumata]|uniref:Putative chemosensory receptor 1 n=1 Tax=Operophtera brumata TaxID=104452 RepID=A0A0L7KV14_OPEBR|nr:putative chemosensory receptor 1 [Operophtera brumata]
MMMFFRMAKKWPELVQKISKTEKMDPNFDYTLTRKCNITCGIVLFLALAEHILSLLSAFAGAEICYPKLGTYEGFVKHFYPWVFNSMPYSPWLGGYEAATYFIFSLVYLIMRSIAVSLIASQVNTASDMPAPVLYDVPSPVYCVEV